MCRSTEPSGFLKRLMMSQTLWAIVPGVGSVTLFRVTLTPRFLARISSPLSILSIHQTNELRMGVPTTEGEDFRQPPFKPEPIVVIAFGW